MLLWINFGFRVLKIRSIINSDFLRRERMQAIILAAGMGKRLKDLTKDCTKCMVKVNGISLIKRMLCQLDGLHLSRIVLVIGYKGKKLVDYISSLDVQTPICYINNPVYEKTNNIYSLSLAKEFDPSSPFFM